MTWVLATLVVACLGLVGVLASGRWGGSLPEVHDDRPDTRLDDGPLPDGPLGPEDIRRVRFPLAVRGYRMEDVDALLARVADQLERDRGGSVPD